MKGFLRKLQNFRTSKPPHVVNQDNKICELAENGLSFSSLQKEDTHSIQTFNSETELIKDEKESNKISTFQGALNVTNIIQGMATVSYPFAVLQGGYWAILSMILVAFITCYTGDILIDCLYDYDEFGNKVRVRSTFVNITEDVWGKRWGPWLVNCIQIMELVMTAILYLVLCGDLMMGCFPHLGVPFYGWVGLTGLLVLPCAFIKNLQQVSIISLWNMATNLIMNGIVIVYSLCYIKQWHYQDLTISLNVRTFPISLGIVVFSYTSHVVLPSLEGGLVNRESYTPMLYTSHAAAAILKTTFAVLGFLTFGRDTKEVISNNFHVPALRIAVNFTLFIKSLLSFPQFYQATLSLIEETWFTGKQGKSISSCLNDKSGSVKLWAILARMSLVIAMVLMAIGIPHFAILMGLIGSITGSMLAFVWPAYFHLRLKYSTLRWYVKLWDLFIVVIGSFCGIIGVIYSSIALVNAIQNHGGHIWIHSNDSNSYNFPQNTTFATLGWETYPEMTQNIPINTTDSYFHW